MQPDEEAAETLLKVKSIGPRRRPKSGTRFPKKLPTYVVAFALKETYDDLVTAQQMICNKRSPQESTNSITPTNSLKMFESEQTVKLDQILDVPENKIKVENETINNSDNNCDINGLEIKISDTNHKEVINYDETEELLNSPAKENSGNNEEVNQPEIIYNAINYGQRSKENKFLRRKPKTHKNVKPKCNKFKCKTPKNAISNRLRNSINPGKIQQGFSNISTVVSRTRVLKKVLAKENLLEENEMISISNDSNLNENDDESLSSHHSTAKNESFISNSSGNTLTCKSSTISSKTDDIYSVNTVKSVLEISQDITPYKTDVINVAVAVAYKKSKVITRDELLPSQEKFMHLGSLTSAETFTKDMVDLTSNIPSEFGKTNTIDQNNFNEISNATLVNMKSSFDVSSDDDTYDMARTSSDFNDSSNNLALTLKNNLEKVIDVKNNELEDTDRSSMKRDTLLQTVINLGYYPEVTPSTSSAGALGIGLNDVIVTECVNQSYTINNKSKGDNHTVNANVLKKLFNEQKFSPTNKNVNLPKQTQIKAMLDDNETQQKKCAEETRYYPTNIPEMWDSLILVLDVAFKRLEDTVSERVVSELKKAIATLELRAQPIPEIDVDLEKADLDLVTSNKVISTQGFKAETDESLQCDLVQNKVIDQIMLKLSSQGPKIIEPGRSIKSLHKMKPKLIRDYFEVLKPPAVASPGVLVDGRNTVTISTITEQFERFHRFRTLLFGPINFIRENVFVITSVPAFFVVLLFVYGLLMLIMKPW